MKTKQQQINEPVLNFTIRFPRSLYKRIKENAINEQKSISLWINEALEKVVDEKQNSNYVPESLSEGVGK